MTTSWPWSSSPTRPTSRSPSASAPSPAATSCRSTCCRPPRSSCRCRSSCSASCSSGSSSAASSPAPSRDSATQGYGLRRTVSGHDSDASRRLGAEMADLGNKGRVVIVGAGFAGFNAARELSRLIGATTEIVVINSTDYFLYLPLLPQVAGGLVEPAHVRVSLLRRLGKTRFVLGTVKHVDARQKTVSWEGPEGAAGQLGYDRLILTAGSVNRLLPIPGIADY